MVTDLAQLACEQGASFDVTYEADGAVRMTCTLNIAGTLSQKQYDRLKQMVQADLRTSSPLQA